MLEVVRGPRWVLTTATASIPPAMLGPDGCAYSVSYRNEVRRGGTMSDWSQRWRRRRRTPVASAGLRQDRGGGQGGGHAASPRAPQGDGGQPSDQRPAGGGPDPPPARIAGGPLRAQRLHPGNHLGDRFLRPVGRRARQGARRADHPRARERDRAGARPRLVHQRPHPPVPRTENQRGSLMTAAAAAKGSIT